MIRTVDLVAEHPFVADLPRPWLERLSLHGRPLMRQTGVRVFREGSPATRFWLIRDGQVALDITDPGRGDIVVERIGAGTVLGWSWLIPPHRWQFGAVAVVPTHTVEFDAAGVRRFIAEDPEFGREFTGRFLAVVAQRLQATRRRLAQLYAVAPRRSSGEPAPDRVTDEVRHIEL